MSLYLGLGFSKLTFDPSRKDKPLLVLTLERVSDGEHLDQVQAFQIARNNLYATTEYVEVFSGHSLATSDGLEHRGWDSIGIASFAQTADFLNVVTGPGYSNLISSLNQDALEETVQYVGHVQVKQAFQEPVVLMLVDLETSDLSSLIETVRETLVSYNGRIHFGLPIENITSGSDSSFDYMALIEFQDPTASIDWLKDTIRKSQFVLLRKQFDDLSLLLAVPS